MTAAAASANPIRLERQNVPLESLLLDPNNPRFFELANWNQVAETMYHLDKVQSMTLARMERADIGQIEELKNSIKSNGYIASENIVVKPYLHADGYYIVIEGNRRLTAMRAIVSESLNPDSDPSIQSLKEVEVAVYVPTGDPERDRTNEMILQGLRHISGPKEWGAYQKANLVVQLHDEMEQGWSEIAERLGLGPRVTSRYYRAFKALQQMMQSDEWGSAANPKLFTLFDEALSRPMLKDWLGWSENDYKFTNAPRLQTFYTMLVGDPEADEDKRMPQITNPQHLRKFASLIASDRPTAVNRFLEGELSLDDAERVAAPPARVIIPFKESLQEFVETLSAFPADQLKSLTEEEFKVFDVINEKFQDFRRLQAAMLAAAPVETSESVTTAPEAA